jgi:hypothetical protein
VPKLFWNALVSSARLPTTAGWQPALPEVGNGDADLVELREAFGLNAFNVGHF